MSRFMRWVRFMCACWLQVFLSFLFLSGHRQRFGSGKQQQPQKGIYRRQPKPGWVIQEVIRLKALMPEAGCRRIAHAFNRRFSRSRQMTVSKSFVNGIIRKYNYEIQVLSELKKEDRLLFSCFLIISSIKTHHLPYLAQGLFFFVPLLLLSGNPVQP